MGKRFSIADYANLVTVSEQDAPEIVRIAYDKIRPNAGNFYAVDDVTDLVNAIQMQGLLSPVVVTPDPEDRDAYILISGHRRHKAWGILRREDPDKYAAMPAIVRSFGSEAEARLALILSNSATRVLSPAEIDMQAQEVERTLYDLKEQGYEFPGRMRDHVAAAVKQSSTKLARLKVIREGLIDPWRGRWKAGKLKEAPAYELAQAPEYIQERIFKVWADAPAYGIATVRKLMAEGVTYEPTTLTGPGCSKCSHGDAFLRHDLENYNFPCKGETCCLKCDLATRDWNPCPRMCGKARQRRTDENNRKKDREAKARELRESETVSRIRESARRLLIAADASGADESAPIPTRYTSVTVADLRKIADGTQKPIFTYCNWLTVDEGLNARKAAEVLGCSADYVCGLTEELQPVSNLDHAAETQQITGNEGRAIHESPLQGAPVPAWQTGTPESPGRYLTVIRNGDAANEYTAEWNGEQWLVFDKPLFPWMQVEAWWPLPDKWEDE